MKTIRIKLSVNGIEKAVRDLEQYRDELKQRTAELVDTLVDGGADAAQAAFGSTATVDKQTDDGYGYVEASGEYMTIKEFGAGLATMEDHPFADKAPYPVGVWEYSKWNLQHGGSGEGYRTGKWHFPPGSKNEYTRVEPRHGILDAWDYIENHVEPEARRLFRC